MLHFSDEYHFPNFLELVEELEQYQKFLDSEKKLGREPIRIVDYISIIPCNCDDNIKDLFNKIKDESKKWNINLIVSPSLIK